MLLDYSNQWFAVQTRTGCEAVVAPQLESRGYETFLPTRRAVKPERASKPAAMFPGYLFCRFGLEVLAPAITTPGLIRILGYGNRPAPIDQGEIESIRKIAEAGRDVEPCPYLVSGQKVVVRRGPLAGAEGIVLSSNGSSALVVSVRLLQRSVKVTLEPSWLESAHAPAKADFSLGELRYA